MFSLAERKRKSKWESAPEKSRIFSQKRPTNELRGPCQVWAKSELGKKLQAYALANCGVVALDLDAEGGACVSCLSARACVHACEGTRV